MGAPAIVLMVVAMAVIWGGLAASTIHAVRSARARRDGRRRG